ncbi:hypothetical protein [Pseudoclavibacter helvolus]|uniref:hypothetical protein n=1 Tax=Pseudoclavibacter helvolus TaxID=255205 RepID=UPI003C78DFDD
MTASRRRELPPLETMRGRWALAAAIETAILGERADNTRADDLGWFFSDGGGSWARLTQLPGGKAVLAGIDRDHSETHQRGIDPRNGIPDWAVDAVETAVRHESGRDSTDGTELPWLGFVYWFDPSADGPDDWRTVAHEDPAGLQVADGLEQHLLPVLSEQRMLETADDWFQGAAMELDDPEAAPDRVDPDSVRRGARLGPRLTAEAIAAVLPIAGMHLEAGVRAASAFDREPAA